MNERQKRLIEVYEHLRKYFNVHTKTEFAEAVHYGRTSMSAAMNGSMKYLTNKLFESICEAFPNVFNRTYLIRGFGRLLTIEEQARCEDIDDRLNNPEYAYKPQQEEKEKESGMQGHADYSSLINATIAAKDDAIESYKKLLKSKDDLIASLEQRIKEKDEYIATLKERLVEYRRTIDSQNLTSYPFPIGAADNPRKPRQTP